MPYPSAFMSRDWVADPEECNTVGEVYGAPRYYNARKEIPTALGGHVCGTEEQWAGEAKRDDAVNVEYLPNGLPACCGVEREASGGIIFSGRATVGYTAPAGPGSTCAGAMNVNLGVPVTVTRAAGATQWFHLYVPGPMFWRVETTGLGQNGMRWLYGGNCSALSLSNLWANAGFHIGSSVAPFHVYVMVNGAAAEAYTIGLYP